ncbi:MAG: DUF1844 domain-containing protein [Thermodesulfobacteriota bacterium]|nr:DUF1844 domain-containing protein [Thermodesulfobacteriota bacterium]
MNEDKEKGYTVRDRRSFSQEKSGQETTAASKERPAGEEIPKESKRPTVLPPVDFSTLIFSLNTSALVHLGEIADPVTGKREIDLVFAKHTIDTIAMLQEKTRGNLTKDEEALIQHILYDLRMRYVREV